MPMSSPLSCPACAYAGPLQRHARRTAWWRDVPEAGRPQVRRDCIVRWRCPHCERTHARTPEWADPSRRMTRRLVNWLHQQAQHGHSVAQLARACGLDDKTVRTMLSQKLDEGVQRR